MLAKLKTSTRVSQAISGIAALLAGNPNPHQPSPADDLSFDDSSAEDYFHQRVLVPVQIGGHTVYASRGMSLRAEGMDPAMLQVPLTNHIDFRPGVRYNVMPVQMQDFGGPLRNWKALMEALVREIKKGTIVHIFCDGGLGRTGTVLASLIALMESAHNTPDPLESIRERYNPMAVETLLQAMAIFDLRREPIPERHLQDFQRLELQRRAFFQQRRQEQHPLLAGELLR